MAIFFQVLNVLTFICAAITVIYGFYINRHDVDILWSESFSDQAPKCGIRINLSNPSVRCTVIDKIEVLNANNENIIDTDYKIDPILCPKWAWPDNPNSPFQLSESDSKIFVFYLIEYPTDLNIKITCRNRINYLHKYRLFPAKIDQEDQIRCDKAKSAKLNNDIPGRYSNQSLSSFLKNKR